LCVIRRRLHADDCYSSGSPPCCSCATFAVHQVTLTIDAERYPEVYSYASKPSSVVIIHLSCDFWRPQVQWVSDRPFRSFLRHPSFSVFRCQRVMHSLGADAVPCAGFSRGVRTRLIATAVATMSVAPPPGVPNAAGSLLPCCFVSLLFVLRPQRMTRVKAGAQAAPTTSGKQPAVAAPVGARLRSGARVGNISAWLGVMQSPSTTPHRDVCISSRPVRLVLIVGCWGGWLFDHRDLMQPLCR
jgi:hypothetical protein